MGEIERPASGQLRIGYAERERAAEELAEHMSAGRLEPDEYTDRVGRVYAARYASDLTPLFADLPSIRPAAPPARPTRQPAAFPLRMILIIALIVACVAWVAFVEVPPFFVFPLFWLVLAGRGRTMHGHRGHW